MKMNDHFLYVVLFHITHNHLKIWIKDYENVTYLKMVIKYVDMIYH